MVERCGGREAETREEPGREICSHVGNQYFQPGLASLPHLAPLALNLSLDESMNGYRSFPQDAITFQNPIFEYVRLWGDILLIKYSKNEWKNYCKVK